MSSSDLALAASDSMPADDIDLTRYLVILRRWYRLILLCAVLGALAAFAVSSFLAKTFEAETNLAIVRGGMILAFDPKIRTVSDTDPSQSVDQAARRKALTTIAQSNDLAQAVRAKLGSQLDPAPRTEADLLGAIAVSSDGELIRIKAKAATAEQAALLANTWAQEYEARVNQIYSESPLTPDDVRAQADAAGIDYQARQQELVAFLRDSPIERLTRQKNLVSQQLDDLIGVDTKLQRLALDAKALRERIASGSPGNPRGDELAALLLEASAFSNWSGLPVSLQIPIDQLSSGSTPAEQLRNLDSLIAALQERRKTLQGTTRDTLQQEINSLQAQLEQANRKSTELSAARDLAWNTYQTLATKVAEATVAAQSKGSVVRLATPATIPTEPVAPRRLINTLLGAVVGLLLGIALAFALHYLDTRLADPEQVALQLGVPTLAVIPSVTSPTAALSAHTNTPDAATEPYRLLRHRLLFDNALHGVLITSALPGEGKSTLAANLAVVAARAGKKIALVDANLREPTLHKLFGLEQGRGLSNLLSAAGVEDATGAEAWHAFAKPTGIDGLTLISAGSPSADPAGALESPAFKTILTQLKAAFDLVIVDTPAVLDLADALAASRGADGIVLTIDSARTTRAEARRAQAALAETGAPLLGVVLNRVAPRRAAQNTIARMAAPAPTVATASSARNNWWSGVRERIVELVGPRPG
ncbi:MAG: polysaccharide biosynthesis tyrosine autokinase [Chloroflexi bacterium]|nr:polysaccharide biosynthesis tyrosine autokinase [Chloroflexota bacterium]